MVASATARGALIVLEGCDRSGKSSQAARLVEYLKSLGRRAVLQRFPDRSTSVGGAIDAYLSQPGDGDAASAELSDGAIHLLFAANRWELAESLRARVSTGCDVVVDRYSYSGIAYSTAKGLDFDWCAAPEAGLPQPDRVYYLRAPAARLAARGGYGTERYERLELQQRVHAVYESMEKDDRWLAVDADDTMDGVARKIADDAAALVRAVGERPLTDIGVIRRACVVANGDSDFCTRDA